MKWIKEKVKTRQNPKNMWPGAKSALVFALNYGPEKNPIEGLKKKRMHIYQYMPEEKITTK